MTNLPFPLRTTNFLSQSICTNIPRHQSPGARPNSHYLCKTDYKMKQKLTTANLGCPDSPGGREGGREGEQGEWAPWGGTRGSWGKKSSPGKTEVQGKSGGWQSNEKNPKESLRNSEESQRKKFRRSRKKRNNGKMAEMWEKRPESLCGERGEARRNIEIT